MNPFVIALLCLLGLVVLLLLIAIIRTVLLKGVQKERKPVQLDQDIQKKYALGLSELLKFRTIASRNDYDLRPFKDMQSAMKGLFPNVFSTMEITYIDKASILARWVGLDSTLKPLILMAHQDVVPAPKEGWVHDPFSGLIDASEVHGRGAFDTKCTLYAFFQAAEELISEGFVPQTDVYLASSSDEEVSGTGAEATVQYLKERNVSPKLVLDEGGAIVSGSLPSSQTPIALIGVIEKGYLNLKIKALSNGGHSSTPPKNSPIARLGKFIAHVETHFPLKTKMIPEVADLFTTASPSMRFPFRLLFGNLWLFKPLLTWLLPKINPYGRAMLSTTIAFTMMKGSDAENVIPSEAYVLMNLRTHPIQDMKSTTECITKIANKYDLIVEVLGGRDASPIVNTKGEAYQMVVEAIKRNFSDVLISPYVILGGTDARHYTAITDASLRFSPIRATNQDLKKMHGLNESIRIDALAEAVTFYKDLIHNFH